MVENDVDGVIKNLNIFVVFCDIIPWEYKGLLWQKVCMIL